jgi:glycosyltransferase involved in cell wall biosynthesis
MRVFVVSPYHGGSHAAWAEGYQRHSGHEVHLLTMEARFWKWRMFGASLTLADGAMALADEVGQPDLILATDMLDLPGFLGRARRGIGDPTVVLYMHENQLTYPLAHGAAEDLTYAFINWQSMEVADAVWWNTAFHRDRVLTELPALLGRFPDHRHSDYLGAVIDRMEVVPVGVEMSDLPLFDKTDPPLILWNHRWEYDKAPDAMMSALDSVSDLEWRVAFCGENFRTVPDEFVEARARFSERVIHYGHADRPRYAALLAEATVALSTARQEFFGISMVEAAGAGCLPLMPDRLSYPEVFPSELHREVLYQDKVGLAEMLRAALSDADAARAAGLRARDAVQRYRWETVSALYDERLNTLRASPR